jgi:type VI protein secretion system component VasK
MPYCFFLYCFFSNMLFNITPLFFYDAHISRAIYIRILVQTVSESRDYKMKLKTRLWISFVIALILFWIALPRLPLYGTTIQFGYSLLWLTFCLLVIGANLYSLLRLGRGESLDKPALTKEQRETIKRIQRYKPRRVPSR